MGGINKGTGTNKMYQYPFLADYDSTVHEEMLQGTWSAIHMCFV